MVHASTGINPYRKYKPSTKRHTGQNPRRHCFLFLTHPAHRVLQPLHRFRHLEVLRGLRFELVVLAVLRSLHALLPRAPIAPLPASRFLKLLRKRRSQTRTSGQVFETRTCSPPTREKREWVWNKSGRNRVGGDAIWRDKGTEGCSSLRKAQEKREHFARVGRDDPCHR